MHCLIQIGSANVLFAPFPHSPTYDDEDVEGEDEDDENDEEDGGEEDDEGADEEDNEEDEDDGDTNWTC